MKMRIQVLMATSSLFRPGASILGTPAKSILGTPANNRSTPNGTTTTPTSTPSPSARPIFAGIKGLSIREKIAPGTSASSSQKSKSKAILSLGGGGRERTFTEKDKQGITSLTPVSPLGPFNNEGLFNDRTSGNISCSSSISSSISSSSGSSKKYSNYSEGVTTTSGRSSSHYSIPSKNNTMDEVSRTIRSRGKVASLIATFSRGGVKGMSNDECDEDTNIKYTERPKENLGEEEEEEDAEIAMTWRDSPPSETKTNMKIDKDRQLTNNQQHTPISLRHDTTNPMSIFACFSFW